MHSVVVKCLCLGFFASMISLHFLNLTKSGAHSNILSLETETTAFHWKTIQKKENPRSKYPITASWLRDRFTGNEWVSTLDQFQSIGGDTIWLRAPPMIPRSKVDILRDPEFAWCASGAGSSAEISDCLTEIERILSDGGIRVKTFATYLHEENFGDIIRFCPKYDAKINSSRIYYRLVLPYIFHRGNDPCSFRPGSDVVVLLTAFSGVDPRELLMRSVSERTMDVYFGLPAAPTITSGSEELILDLLPAYYNWVQRVLNEHLHRYGSSNMLASSRSTQMKSREPHPVRGYYVANEKCIAELQTVNPDGGETYLQMYKTLAEMVHDVGKLFALSPYIILNQSQKNYSATDHVLGFEKLVTDVRPDIVAVQEGRGCAKGSYFWPNQKQIPIRDIDPVLDQIIHYLNPTVQEGVTFAEQFTASNNELFQLLEAKSQKLNSEGIEFEFWLNVEAFEFLRTDPCLPVDPAGSGMAELLQRTTKSRLDWALTVAGATPKKIISFSWDSDFTCTTHDHRMSLADDIRLDGSRPIVSHCEWFSQERRTLSVLGYNLQRAQQSFQIQYQDTCRTTVLQRLFANYVDTSYGTKHNKVPTLQLAVLKPLRATSYCGIPAHGMINVSATRSFHPCVFQY